MSLEMMIGEVEAVKGRYVGTVFLALVGPLVPLRSMYVESLDVQAHAGGRTYAYRGIDLPLCLKSVVLAYLRVWLAVAACASPFVLMWGQSVDFDLGRWEWQVTLALVAAWIFMLAVPGRLRGERKAQVELLGDVTGVYLDPTRFDPIQREGRCADLGQEIARHGAPIGDAEKARAWAARADAKLLRPMYAFARYAAVDAPEWQAVADEIWSRLSRA